MGKNFVLGTLKFYYSYSLQNHSQTLLVWNTSFLQRNMPSVFLQLLAIALAEHSLTTIFIVNY